MSTAEMPVISVVSSATALAVFEEKSGGKVLLGVVRVVKACPDVWTLRCSADTSSSIKKLRTLIECYAGDWLKPRSDGTVTGDAPDLQLFSDLCRRQGLKAEALPVDDYALSLQFDRSMGLMVAAAPGGASWRLWFDRAKEAVSFAKDLLEVVLKLSPLGLIPPAMMLAMYLRSLGWSELLLDSLGSVSGLVTLLGYVIFFMLVSIMQFCLPSALIAPLSGWLNHRKKEPLLNLPLLCLCLVLPLVWTASFGACVALWPDSGSQPGWIAIGVVMVTDASLLVWLKRRMKSSDGWDAYLTLERLLLVGAFSSMGAIFSIFPLLVVIRAVETQSMSLDHPWMVLAGCSIVSVAGLIPGTVKIKAELSGQKPGRTAVLTLGAFLCVGYLVGGLLLTAAPISAYVMRASGVYSSKAGVYQIRKPELSAAFRAANMQVFSARPNDMASTAYASFVGAFLRYNFGGAKLLCKRPFDPFAVKQKDQKPSPFLEAGDDCVPVRADEVTPIRRRAA